MHNNQIAKEKLIRYHVEVSQCGPGAPVHRAGLDSLDPQVVREHQREDGDALKMDKSWDQNYEAPTLDGMH